MRRLLLAGLAATVAAIAADSSSPVTFSKDVLPILQKNCQSCHRPGQIAPMSLLTYQDARPWAKAIKTAVSTRKMPPWFADQKYGHFANDRSLKQTDIDTMAKWVDSGAPEGNPKDAPAPVAWPKEGWGITNLEAAACATPVVASNSPGIRESVVDGKTGYLIKNGEPISSINRRAFRAELTMLFTSGSKAKS